MQELPCLKVRILFYNVHQINGQTIGSWEVPRQKLKGLEFRLGRGIFRQKDSMIQKMGALGLTYFPLLCYSLYFDFKYILQLQCICKEMQCKAVLYLLICKGQFTH